MRKHQAAEFQPLSLANSPKLGLENKTEIRGLANELDVENPAAAATANGVKTVYEATQLQKNYTTANESRASAIKVFDHALTLDCFDGWNGAAAVWSARLPKRDRVQLSWAALRSLDWHDAYITAESVLGTSTPPGPSLFNPMPEARFWADRSTTAELDAYALAAFEAMTADRQAAFLGHVLGRTAA